MTQPTARPSRLIPALLLLLAVVSVALAVIYFSTAAKDLPGFLPGHQAGLTRHHTKHGLGALALAVVLAVAAYFSLGAKDRT